MSYRKNGLKALGLSFLAALGLMAFMAVSAQAAAQFDLVEGGVEKAIGSTVGFSGNLRAGQEALLLAPTQKLVIHCTTVAVDDGLLFTTGFAHAGLLYSGCITKQNGTTLAKCVPTIPQVNVEVKPILHNGIVYLLAQPLDLGANFVSITYPDPNCVLLDNNVTGSVVFECENGTLGNRSCSLLAVKQLIKPAATALFKGDPYLDELRYGANEAFLDGEAEVFLTGANSGKEWNALE